MSIQIHTATREESNNRAMLAPESKTRSGIVLRAISLGCLKSCAIGRVFSPPPS